MHALQAAMEKMADEPPMSPGDKLAMVARTTERTTGAKVVDVYYEDDKISMDIEWPT